jgi:hypothetical protein
LALTRDSNTNNLAIYSRIIIIVRFADTFIGACMALDPSDAGCIQLP